MWLSFHSPFPTVKHFEKSKVGHLYRGSLRSDRCRAEPLYNTPLVHWTLYLVPHYGALAWKPSQGIPSYTAWSWTSSSWSSRGPWLGEQRHIRCEQLAQGCCPNNAAVGVEPATSRSRVQRSNHYTTGQILSKLWTQVEWHMFQDS